MRIRNALHWAGGYPLAAAAVVLFTAVCVPFRDELPVQTFMLLYVPLVVGIARFAGTRPSAFTAVLSVLLVDYFLVEPYHRLTVSRLTEWVALGVFLVIALVAGQQTGRLRERERAALRGQRELALLNRVSFRMVSDESVGSTLAFLISQIGDALGSLRVALYLRADDGRMSVAAESGDEAGSVEADFVRWVMENDKAVGLSPGIPTALEPRPVGVGVDEVVEGARADGAYLPVQTARRLEGVLYCRLDEDGPASPDDTRLLVAAASLASAALHRRWLESEASHLEAEHEADRLKSSIVSSVSHQLKTPLAAAVARVTGLLGETAAPDQERIRDEMSAIADELGRLNVAIGDLLDVSRLESDSWTPVTDFYEPGEILGTVASRLTPQQSDRVRFDLPASVPFVEADFNQLVRALENVLENALAYSGQESPVRVRVTHDDKRVRVVVEDHGPGVPDAEKSRIFEKFYRGSTAEAVPGGTGLGLSIAREIVNTHGGRIWVEDAQPHGARFIVELPVAVIGAKAE